MKRSKRKVQGKAKSLLSVVLAALTIGSTVVTTGSLTGVGISASAVSDTVETNATIQEENDSLDYGEDDYSDDDYGDDDDTGLVTAARVKINCNFQDVSDMTYFNYCDAVFQLYLGSYNTVFSVSKDYPEESFVFGEGSKLTIKPSSRDYEVTMDTDTFTLSGDTVINATLTPKHFITVVNDMDNGKVCNISIGGKEYKGKTSYTFAVNDMNGLTIKNLDPDYFNPYDYYSVLVSDYKYTTLDVMNGSILQRGYLNKIVDDETGVSIQGVLENEKVVVKATKLDNEIDDAVLTYNIGMTLSGKTIQPDGDVTISIPCDIADGKVVCIKDDGTQQEMNTLYENGCYEFKTKQLGVYAVIAREYEYSINDDGTVTITKYHGNGSNAVIPSEIDGKVVTTIGKEAFSNSSNLTNVEIPNTITKIGEYAFLDCDNLKSVKIPDSVTEIGGGAFAYYSFEESCWTYEDFVIYGSEGSEAERYADDNRIRFNLLSTENGLMYKPIQGEIIIIDYKGNESDVVIPAEIDGIAVTKIGEGAFRNCSSIKTITIPNTIKEINSYTFDNCENLTSVVIPDSVTSIGWSAFYNCDKLTSVVIPDSVVYIGGNAFYNCYNFEKITVPDSVAYIGRDAFYSTAWYNNQPDGMVYAGKIAYEYKGEMPENTTIVLKDGIKGISNSAFEDCTELTSITIPNSVTSIGYSAFCGCTGLTSIVIPDSVTEIDESAFDRCTGLTKVTIGKGIKTIGERVFGNCSGLTSITIPDGVTTIDYEAFYNCKNLKDVIIPDSVTSIGDNAFEGCTGLTSITIPDSVTEICYGAFEGCTGLTSITIPDSVTSIGWHAFEGCTGLTSVTIPDSVTYIGGSAFESCYELTSVTIGNNVTEIDNYAFYECTSLKKIFVPDSVKLIGMYALGYEKRDFGLIRSSDFIIYASEGSEAEKYAKENDIKFNVFFTDSGFEYKAHDDIIDILGYVGTDTEITIPSEIDGKKVTSIGYRAFYYCKNLTSITIPDSVISIDPSAFEYCTKLKSVTIPDSVTFIGNRAFYNTAWYNNQPDGVVYAGKVAYKYKGEMPENTNITLKNGTKSIAQDAFSYCIGLTSVTIPNGVTYIGGWAFSDCTYLKSVTIPDSVISIGRSAFSDCTGLTSITIQNSITEIGDFAFVDCTGLTSVTIPDSVISIGDRAFGYYCDDDLEDKLIDGFTIYGLKGSAAETYANENNISFVETIFNNSTISAKTITKGNSVILTGKATGGTAPYTYAYYYKKTSDKSWKTAKDWSSTTSVSIKPAYATTYDICIKVKDSKGKIAKKYFTVSVKNAPLANNSTVGATTITKGSSVTLTGSATGGTAPYQYAYFYKKTTDKSWKVAKDWSSSTSVSIKPAYATTYDVCIKVKDSNGKIAKKYFTVNVTAPLANNSIVSATTITKGNSLTLTGKATGGTAHYQYAYYYKKTSDKSWKTAKDWSSTTSVSIKPAYATRYDICIKVKDSKGTVAKKYYTINVTGPLANNSTVGATMITKGSSVTLTGKATGGTAPYTYAYYYKKTSDTSWKILKSWSSTESLSFKPELATTYDICIKVKDAKGTVDKKYFAVNVTEPLENNSTISATTINKGDTVALKAIATGGTAPYQYSFTCRYSSSTSWQTLKSYNSGSIRNWTPARTGKYQVCAKVKDANGTEVKKYFTLTVK